MFVRVYRHGKNKTHKYFDLNMENDRNNFRKYMKNQKKWILHLFNVNGGYVVFIHATITKDSYLKCKSVVGKSIPYGGSNDSPILLGY